jgi:hypothetical protein
MFFVVLNVVNDSIDSRSGNFVAGFVFLSHRKSISPGNAPQDTTRENLKGGAGVVIVAQRRKSISSTHITEPVPTFERQ